jgi:hypothetical protein
MALTRGRHLAFPVPINVMTRWKMGASSDASRWTGCERAPLAFGQWRLRSGSRCTEWGAPFDQAWRFPKSQRARPCECRSVRGCSKQNFECGAFATGAVQNQTRTTLNERLSSRNQGKGNARDDAGRWLRAGLFKWLAMWKRACARRWDGFAQASQWVSETSQTGKAWG